MRYELSFQHRNPRITLCLRQRHKLYACWWLFALFTSDRLTKCTFKHKNKGQKQFDMQPVKISIAVMFVDEGVVSNTAEAALLLNSCRMRQQHDGGQEKKNRYRGRKEKWHKGRRTESDKRLANDLCREYIRYLAHTHIQAYIQAYMHTHMQ